MTRSFLRGPFQPSLERALVAFVRGAKERDRLATVRVLVPSHLLALHLRRMLGRELAHIGIRFETIDDVALRLTADRRAQEGLRILPHLAFERLVATLAQDAPADSYFGPVRNLPGFAPRLAATIRDVRDAGLAPPDVVSTLDSAKAREFAARLAAYQERRERSRFVDGAALLSLATEALDAEVARGEPLVVYGFYDFTAVQWQFVERAMRRGEVLFLAPIVDGAAGRFGAPLIRRLRGLGFTERRPDALPAPDSDRTRLQAVLNGLSHPAGSSDGTVRFLAPRFRGEEPRAVLRQLDEWVAEGSTLPSLAVLYRQRPAALAIDREFATFERAMEAASIPRFIQGGVPLTGRRIAAALIELVEAMESRFARRKTFALLDALAVPRVHALERTAKEAGVLGRRGIEEWSERLSAVAEILEVPIADPDDDEVVVTGEADREALAREVSALVELVAALKQATTYGTAVRVMVDFVGARFPHADRAALEPVVDACAAIDELGLTFDRATLGATLASALAAESESTVGFERGLFVGGILGARGLSFARIVLPSLEEGVFPRAARQDPILLDDERRALAKNDLEDRPGLALASRSADEERLLFALACGAAQEQLVLSCPRREDAAERNVVPSSSWRDAIEALLGEAWSGERPWLDPRLESRFVTQASAPLDVREFDRNEVLTAVRERDPDRARFVADLEPSVRHSLIATRSRGIAREFTIHDGVVPSALARPVLAKWLAAPLSASRLQDYAKCPFQFFALELLGVDRSDPRAEDELDFRFRGVVLHEALQHYLSAVVSERRPWPPPPERFAQELAILVALGRDALTPKARAVGMLPILEAAAALAVEDDLRAFLEAECARPSSLAPYRFEQAFGMGQHRPWVLEANGQRFEFKGMIDRIDFDPERRIAAVIDYKSGKPEKLGDGLDGGRKLQLPIYAFAAADALPRGTRILSSEYFFFTRRGGGKREGLGEEMLDEHAKAEVAECVGVLVDHMRKGMFFADPSVDRICENCDYSLACGLGAGLEGRFERKRADPAAADLMALRGARPNDEDAEDSEAES